MTLLPPIPARDFGTAEKLSRWLSQKKWCIDADGKKTQAGPTEGKITTRLGRLPKREKKEKVKDPGAKLLVKEASAATAAILGYEGDLGDASNTLLAARLVPSVSGELLSLASRSRLGDAMRSRAPSTNLESAFENYSRLAKQRPLSATATAHLASLPFLRRMAEAREVGDVEGFQHAKNDLLTATSVISGLDIMSGLEEVEAASFLKKRAVPLGLGDEATGITGGAALRRPLAGLGTLFAIAMLANQLAPQDSEV